MLIAKICPECGGAIPPRDQNPATDLAACRGCGKVFSYRDVPDNPRVSCEPADLPEHIRYRMSASGVEVVSRALFAYCLIGLPCAYLAVAGIFRVMNPGLNPWPSISAAFLAGLGMLWLSRRKILIDPVRRELRIVTGFKSRTIAFADIAGIETARQVEKTKQPFAVNVVGPGGERCTLLAEPRERDADLIAAFLGSRVAGGGK